MTKQLVLQIILFFGIFGLLFSGYLSYTEIWGGSPIQCPSPGKSGTVLGYPACIYGFFMYLLITLTALIGLFSKSDK